MNTLNFPFNFPTTSGVRTWFWELLFLKEMEIERKSTSMIKLNNLNYATWKSMMKDFLTTKDFSNTLKGEEAKPEDIS